MGIYFLYASLELEPFFKNLWSWTGANSTKADRLWNPDKKSIKVDHLMVGSPDLHEVNGQHLFHTLAKCPPPTKKKIFNLMSLITCISIYLISFHKKILTLLRSICCSKHGSPSWRVYDKPRVKKSSGISDAFLGNNQQTHRQTN